MGKDVESGQVHFPPSSGMLDEFGVRSVSECVYYGQVITLVFDHSGFLAYGPLGDFTPNFPMGYFAKDARSKPCTAVSHDADVVMCFFDLETFLMSVVTLTIRANCTEKKAKKKPKKK
jgi:hypothetical protein